MLYLILQITALGLILFIGVILLLRLRKKFIESDLDRSMLEALRRIRRQ